MQRWAPACWARWPNFCGEAWTAELAADWETAYHLVATVMIEAAREVAATPAWWDAKVVTHEQRTFDIAVLRVQPDAGFTYQPGQSVSVQTELRPRLWRSYSIANVPRADGTLDFHVQLIDGGPVSSALVRHITVGDLLRLSPPLGQLTLNSPAARDLVLVAGGTDLAPLKALVEHNAAQHVPRRIHLFFGARTAAGLYDLQSERAGGAAFLADRDGGSVRRRRLRRGARADLGRGRRPWALVGPRRLRVRVAGDGGGHHPTAE